MDVRGGTVLRRGVAIGAVLAAMLAGAAARAQAFMAYTGDGQPGVGTATVYGYLDTTNFKTHWAFQYGPTDRYGHWSSVGTVPRAKGTVMVAAVLTALSPSSHYHYRLVAVPLTSSGRPDWPHEVFGQDSSFTTEREQLDLVLATVPVRAGSARIVLQCLSARTCSGGLSLRLRAHRGQGAGCASDSVRVPAWGSLTVSPKLGARCRTLLARARQRRLAAVLTVRVTSRQAGLRDAVTLTR